MSACAVPVQKVRWALAVEAGAGCPDLQGFLAGLDGEDEQGFNPWDTKFPPVARGDLRGPGIDGYTGDVGWEGITAVFLDRATCETDPKYKQVIPYGVVHRDGKILCYRRPSKNAEARLSGLRSLGFGGHVEREDLIATAAVKPNCRAGDVIEVALARELTEELGQAVGLDTMEYKFRGWLNHDDTPVGQVHLGLVYSVELSFDTEINISDEITEPEWLSVAEAYVKINEFEVWSQFVLRWLASVGTKL